MDPNETLRLIRKYAEQVDREKTQSGRAAAGMSLARHVRDLDEWLGRGGFLPREWQFRNPIATLDA